MRYRTLTTAGTGFYFTRSDTPHVPGAGSKTFAVPAGLTFTVGAQVAATSVFDPESFMLGVVASYSSVTLVITVSAFSGTTSYDDWVINTQAPIEAHDMTFGAGSVNFLVDSPDAVAQSVLTRLRLWTGEWFLDETEGTPYLTAVVGKGTNLTYEPAIRERILGTTGVSSIIDLSTSIDPDGRTGTFRTLIETTFGAAAAAGNL